LVLRALQEHLVPPGYVAALLALVVLGLIQTMKEGNTFGPFFRAVSRFGMSISRHLHIRQL
jgi:hypothetical protein